MMKRGGSEAAIRFQERLQRERDAQRLHNVVPSLATLRLDITEGRGVANSDPTHARMIQVGTSPALFAFVCADRSCRDGGYEITNAILHGLRAGSEHFTVDESCRGTVGSADCGRNMHVEVTATYRTPGSGVR